MNNINTVYHEAGHVAAYIHLGVKFRYVTVIPKESSLGHVKSNIYSKKFFDLFEYGSHLLQKDKIEKELVILLAGMVAEAKWAGKKNHVGARFDYQQVNNLLLRIFDETIARAYFKYILVLTEFIVTKEWLFIEDLSKELQKKKTLKYLECLEVYSQAYQISIPGLHKGLYS